MTFLILFFKDFITRMLLVFWLKFCPQTSRHMRAVAHSAYYYYRVVSGSYSCSSKYWLPPLRKAKYYMRHAPIPSVHCVGIHSFPCWCCKACEAEQACFYPILMCYERIKATIIRLNIILKRDSLYFLPSPVSEMYDDFRIILYCISRSK